MTETYVLPTPDTSGAATSEEAAAAWAAYLHSGATTEEGLAAFRSWLSEDAVHVKSYARIEQAWADAGLPATEHLLAMEVDSAPSRMRLEPVRRWVNYGAIGAILAVALTVSVTRLQPEPVTAQPFAFETTIGEVAAFTLPDGSSVTLAPNTFVSGAMSNSDRTVTLLSGRAFFKVWPDEDRPFALDVLNTQILVLGTAFDVHLRPDDVRISVTEGVVRVSNERQLGEAHELNAGEMLVATSDGAPGEVMPIDAASLSWRTGRLQFINARLEDVVAEVNRYRASPIVLIGAGLNDERITFSIPADQSDQLIEALEATLPVEARELSGRTVISRIDP